MIAGNDVVWRDSTTKRSGSRKSETEKEGDQLIPRGIRAPKNTTKKGLLYKEYVVYQFYFILLYKWWFIRASQFMNSLISNLSDKRVNQK